MLLDRLAKLLSPVGIMAALAVPLAFADNCTTSSQAALFGIYDSQNDNPAMDLIQQQEAWQGCKPAVVHFFCEWCGALADNQWYYDWVFSQQMPNIWNYGSVPLMSWQPQCWDPANPSPLAFVSGIAAGNYDTYINKWATLTKQFLSGPDGIYGTADDRRAYIRLGHEMNSNLYNWCPASGHISTQDYIGMWVRVRNIFSQQGIDSTRLQFIWCPNNFESGGSAPAETFYPGSKYVDWVGLDVYNGGEAWGIPWGTPEGQLQPMTSRLRALTADSPKPIAIVETGCNLQSNPGLQGKSDWISGLFSSAYSYGIQMISYFNVQQWAVHGWQQPDVDAFPSLACGSQHLIYPDAQNPRLISDADFMGN